MATQIYNGTTAQILSNEIVSIILIDSTGKDIFTGNQIYNGTTQQILSQCQMQIIQVDDKGDVE